MENKGRVLTRYYEMYIKSRKHYHYFLRFTSPKREDYPNNLLELLDNSFKRMIKYRELMIVT